MKNDLPEITVYLICIAVLVFAFWAVSETSKRRWQPRDTDECIVRMAPQVAGPVCTPIADRNYR
jgi:hypothetical protein